MLPPDFGSAPTSDKERVTAFCGACQHFDIHPLGGGGQCHKRHDPEERAREKSCDDRTVLPKSEGPLFDLSE